MIKTPDNPNNSNEVTANSTARSSFAFVMLALAMAICLTVIFYSVTTTASTDPEVRPYAVSLGVGLAVSLLLFGLVDINRAAKGLFASALSVLPKIHAWGAQSIRRASIFTLGLIIIAVSSVWVGPNAIVSQIVKCDDAAEIEFSIRPERVKCDGAISRDIWLSPFERNAPTTLYCYDGTSNRWDGTFNESSASYCGPRPQDASFIKNGIELPKHDPLTVVGARLFDGHSRLRKALKDSSIPNRKVKDRLLFATWNIRDLGAHRFGYGDRLDESYVYIAEVISHFDIVAIQELKDQSGLKRLLELLGDNYRAEFSFISPGASGNRERLGFIYDTRKVSFGDFSTTIVFEGIEESVEKTKSRTGQPARPPFLAEFVVNGRKFFAVTTHAYFGQSSGQRFERRLLELEQMATGIDRTFARNFPEHPVIFAGDMNVSSPDGREMKTLIDNGFEAPTKMREQVTNIGNNRPYDQILIRSATANKMPIGRYDVFKPTEYVFRLEDWEEYRVEMQRLVAKRAREKRTGDKIFQQFRTFQISDHHLRWAEFILDWQIEPDSISPE